MERNILFIILGLAAGVLSGLIGIGGGVIVVPALLFLFGFSQHLAQGTTLGMLVPPVGLLAAWMYYKQGYMDIKVSLLLCVGFFIGGLLGAKAATHISNVALEKIFGVAMLFIGLKMILTK